MSISSAISNSVSGLTATSRGIETVSSNLANALTPGYARRETDLASRVTGHGGGVGINGVDRIINTALLADSRLAQAKVGAADTVASFHAAMEGAFGTTTGSTSLDNSLVEFEAALTAAAARPDSETRLSAVLDTATALTGKINEIATAIQSERTKAEQTIKQDVARLNHALGQVADLNSQIVSVTAQGRSPASLLDARQAAIDAIAQIVPVKEVARENGRVALFTAGGAILLDGTAPAEIGFDSAAGMNANMSLPGGQLSALTFNGKPLTGVQQEMFAGGTMAASFDIRDRLAPGYQSQIDAFARELYDRLADPAVDPSLSGGGPGIFADNQDAFDAANEIGFSSRLSTNAAIDPEAGGALWRLRAGVNSSDPGSAGESGLLTRMGDALAASRPPVSATLSNGKRNLQVLSTEMASSAASKRIRSAADAVQSSTHHTSLKAALLADGVDTDKEMESLLALERAYSANAKVFQTANDMLDAILRLT